MDENRLNNSIALIQTLLGCPSGQELSILEANQELVDDGFVELIKVIAEEMTQKGEAKTAKFLSQLADKIGEAIESAIALNQTNTDGSRSEAYQEIVGKVMSCATIEDGYAMVQSYPDLIDGGLVQAMAMSVEQLAHTGNGSAAEFLIGVTRKLVKDLKLNE